MRHVFIRSLTDGARVAGLILRENQQVEIDIEDERISELRVAVAAGDILVSGIEDQKPELLKVEPVVEPLKGKSK